MDWIGVALNLTGWYLMPTRKILAIKIFLIGNVLWFTWAASREIYSIVFIQLCFAVLNVRTIRMWRIDD